MDVDRAKRAKYNIIVSFGCQIISLICGFIVPQLLIKTYGSEAYGATASIAQFLAYITLLEGGIGGVARASLYKPLADNDIEKISSIVNEIKKFFRYIGYIFVIYVIILACSFHRISDIHCFDWLSTAILVVVISIATFGQYFIGISSAVLIQAAQCQYVTNLINICTTVMNTICTVFLVFKNCNLIVVKLISSMIFFLRPVLLSIYVKKKYHLNAKAKRDKDALKQKWSGLGQHIAYFLHSNTDVAVLTLFGNLTAVAVYAVYSMVVSAIQNLTSSFVTGMESLFGDMLAKKEIVLLNDTFSKYETLISIVSSIMFGITAVLIIPFVKIYTSGVGDANYVEPLFGILLTIASLLFCLRTPYHSLIIAAGHFKETQFAAYGEAIVNITTSIILVVKYGLIGVAIGTVLAVSFRFIYYVIYLSKHIIYRGVELFIKRCLVNIIVFVLIYFAGSYSTIFVDINNYFKWIFVASIVGVEALVISFSINYFLYKDDISFALTKISRKGKK